MPAPGRPLTRIDLLIVIALVAVAAALRFAGLGQGIPFAIGVDEPEIMERAVNMMRSGDFHPHFFDYPSLYIYLQSAVATVRFMTGAMAGHWATLDQAPVTEFYLWGRAVTALFGTATVALVYVVASRFGRLAATTAALFLAVQPMHVRESHYVLTDVPMTFFVTLTLVLTLRAFDRRTLGAYAWAGAAAGLAAATKYNGGIALLVPILALGMARHFPRRLASALVVVCAAGAAFLIAAPYTVLDLPDFLNAFGTLSHMYAVGQPPPEPGWLLYGKHLRNNLGWPGLLLAMGSMLVAVERSWRAPVGERPTWATTAAFAAIAFWLISGQRLIYGRYLLSVLPALAILMGGAIGWLATRLRTMPRTTGRPRVASAVLAGAIAFVGFTPASAAIGWARMNARTGTAALTYAWLVEHVPAGSRIAVESRGLLLPPDRFDAINHPRLIERDLSEYQADGYTWLVASSQSFGDPLTSRNPDAATRAYRMLFDRLELVMTFRPSAENPGAEWRIYRVPR